MATGTIELLPAAAAFPDESTDNLAAGFEIVKGTQANDKVFYPRLIFKHTRIERCMWTFRMPADYASGGTLKLELQTAVTTAGDIVMQARVAAVTAADADTPQEHAWAAAAASAAIANNATEAGRLIAGSVTLTMDSAAAGDLVTIQLFRDAAHASDTLDATVYAIVAAFEYTTT